MGSILQIVGVPGVGKTHIAKTVSSRTRYKFVDFADLMLVAAIEKKYLINPTHDDLQNLPWEQTVDIVKSARDALSYISEDEKVVLETHVGVEMQELGYVFTSPIVMRDRNTVGVVFISADASDIDERSTGDMERLRRHRLPNEIAEAQMLNLVSVISSCTFANIPFKVIKNKQDYADLSIDHCIEFLNAVEKLKILTEEQS